MHSIDKQFFVGFLVFRLSSVYIIKSSFVPDEYWQAVEVSHRLTFGYGYLTWEWEKHIRSCCYSFAFHLLYKLLPESPFIIIQSPRILQAVLSAIGDFYAYKFASEYFGKSCGSWTSLNIFASWFLYYCSPRTITNMAEASLTSCGFYFYPWSKTKQDGLSTKYLWFAGASAMIRPTAIVTWFPLYIWHIWREYKLSLLVRNTFLIGSVILTIMLLIDKWCYGQWVFTHYNFFYFNWKNDIGAFYGSHPFLWYYTIGLPTILGIQIIPFLLGVTLYQLKKLYFLILWVLIIFSIPSHKEFRFLLPILHLCLIICGVVMDEIWSGRMFINKIRVNSRFNIVFSVLIMIINVPIIIYMGLFHQKGVIDAVHHLSETVNEHSSVIFLMPCHSTPYYSYIHQNINMKFLSCDPNFEHEDNYIEEADAFFSYPYQWLYEYYEQNITHRLPSHIVAFDSLYPKISKFLDEHSYEKCFSAFHSHFAERRTGKYVNIYCK